MKVSKIKNEDFVLLTSVYEGLGHDKFIRLCELLNNYCVEELGVCDSENCKRTPIDDSNEMCIKCLANKLKELYND